MYNLQKINPKNWQDYPILIQYFDDLPTKPYCSYVKNFCEIRTKKRAIERVYIQPNPPVRVNYIVIDIDHPNGIHNALYDADLPPPHLIIQNPKNAHVHLVYKLKNPVFMWGKAKPKHIRYLARIEHGMVKKLGADASYGGNLMKNPMSDVWTTYTTTAPLEGYTLKHLAQFVNLDVLPSDDEAANDQGFGRNCNLFDQTRPYGYNESTASYSALVKLLTPIAENFNNQFEIPLFKNEVMHIVRSIARYCTRTDFTASHKAFSETQRARITIRWGDNTEQQKQAMQMYADGIKKTIIAEQLGVTTRTLTNWGLRKKKK
nr:replication protein [Psychrobacter sp.]QJS05347.1 replication protein, RepA-like [Psychrobacter sp.]QJS05428.1 replication protein RepA [Psychrobacter sp.]QJS05827.1 replication protein [Psychrobacter sp.]